MPTISKSSPKRPWQPERKAQERRITQSDGFYHTREWRAARRVAMQLNMEKYGVDVAMCEACMELGVWTVANTVDHTERRTAMNRALWLEQSNLKCMCSSCHNSKSGSEAHNKTKE